MADITPGTVKVGSTSAQVEVVTAGATITAGDCLYYNSATDKYLISDCTAASTDEVSRIALSGGADDEPIAVMKPGQVINLGATLTVAEIYVLSVTGAIAPVADLASNDYVTIVGYGQSTSLLKFQPVATGFQVP